MLFIVWRVVVGVNALLAIWDVLCPCPRALQINRSFDVSRYDWQFDRNVSRLQW